MERQNKGLFALMLILTITVCVMSVGFAASSYSASLKINGTATVRSAQWKVAYVDTSYTETTGSVEATSKSVSDDTFTFNVTLTKPGDFYETTVTVKNSGTLNAKLTGITLSSNLTDAQKKYVKYTVKYADQDAIEASKSDYAVALNADATANVVVRAEYVYPDDAADLPTTDQTNISLTGTLSYVQVD